MSLYEKAKRLTTPKSDHPLDLTDYAEPEYVCEKCDYLLWFYPQGTIDFPMQRGPHYICPNCHVVTDISATKPLMADDIQPIPLTPPSFEIIQEDKGDKTNIQPPYDPEPNEDQWLKNIGATLISKRIEVSSDF